MRVSTLVDLAREQDNRLPANLTDTEATPGSANERGWFRFQQAYDAARKVVRSEEAMRRIVREAAADDAAEELAQTRTSN